ncbi:MAG TPA: DnaJ domain-containing protein [Hyphomicrobiales bacterium]|nr:DnaJ domain-containing protein [Hyphomicrobiales bacterium]
MPAFLGLVFLVALAVAALYAFAYVDVRTVTRNMHRVAGGAMILVAGVLGLVGRWSLALPLGFLGVSVLIRGWPGFLGSARKSPGQRSRVRSRHLDMTLDHDTGEMDGTVRTGRFTGESLASLNLAELQELYGEVAGDAESVALIETYLDRRFPDWRGEAGKARAGNGRDSGRGGGKSGAAGPMTVEEARNVLGVGSGATDNEIRAAHRRLMKNLHPDQGGSTYLAAKLNEARDLLLNRGRKGR